MLLILLVGCGFVMLVAALVFVATSGTTLSTQPSPPVAPPPASNPVPSPSEERSSSAPTPRRSPDGAEDSGGWRNAMLTCYTESQNFASAGTDPSKHNVVAVHERDWAAYKNKRVLLKLPNGTHTVEVRDYCNAKVPECNKNVSAQGNNFLIDINHLALRRLWPSQSCDNTFQTVQFKRA